MSSILQFKHVMVYPTPPFVVLWQFWFLPFPLSQIGQSDLLHVAASVGEFFVIRDFRDTPPCSAIFGFTSPLLCCFISSAISFHEAARAPLGLPDRILGSHMICLLQFYTSMLLSSLSLSLSSSLLCSSLYLCHCGGVSLLSRSDVVFFPNVSRQT